MSGECVIFLVLSHHSKDLKQWTSVIAQLQFSFIWQVKGSTPLRHEVRSTPKGEASLLLLPLYICFSPPPFELPYVCCTSQERGVFVSPEVLTLLSMDFLLFNFAGFSLSLSFSHRHFGLLFPILTT